MAYTSKAAGELRRQSGSLLEKVASELALIDAELALVQAGDRVLADGDIFVGDATNIAAAVTMSGDATITNTGALTIAAKAVELSMMADLATGSTLIGAANRPTALDLKGDGKIVVGNGTTATSVSVSGDATLANTGELTLAADAVTSAKTAPTFVQEATATLAGGAENAFAFAWQNPEATAILVWQVLVDITTAGGTGGALLDIGSAANATTHGDNLIDGVDANAVGVFSSANPAGAGTNGLGMVKLAEKDGATDYLTGQILVANGNDLAGKVYIYYTALSA